MIGRKEVQVLADQVVAGKVGERAFFEQLNRHRYDATTVEHMTAVAGAGGELAQGCRLIGPTCGMVAALGRAALVDAWKRGA